MINNFLNRSNNIVRDSYIWNLIGSSLNAFQSVFMLILITHITTLSDAGIFSIAYANSILFLNIGKYGMRNFQISDYNSQFSFSEYKLSRIITSGAMLLTSIIYISIISHINDYSLNKNLIVLVMCLYKLIDAIEDVYHGLYQKNNRLDIAGKSMSLRMIITIISFCVLLIATKSLLISLTAATAISYVLLIYITTITFRNFKVSQNPDKKNVIRLLTVCFPLFLSMFLSFYINNAPKYAIDSILNDELQACYGFIVMPVFVIELLNSFIFNPILYNLTNMWKNNEINAFKKSIIKQAFIIAGITIICELLAYWAGIPVLSALYGTDLNPYKKDLLILLLAGGGLALSGFFVIILTIMRSQRDIIIIYSIVSIIAMLLSRPIVRNYMLTGASYLYLILMLLLSVFLSAAIMIIIKSKNR